MKPLLYDKVITSLSVEIIQWLISENREKKIDEVFRDSKKDKEEFDKWVDENLQ
jgi:hypothetical protein